MIAPAALLPLVDLGVIDEVVEPVRSGKEADVFIVKSRGELRVAKVYKSRHERSFRQKADYIEGRVMGDARTSRAVRNRSRLGKRVLESHWRTREAVVLRSLFEAGASVPEPFDFVEDVLIMELVLGPDGAVAPRLKDAEVSPDEARRVADRLVEEIVVMLCAGYVHGDLSAYNVLLSAEGPVIIDLPQAVDAGLSPHARDLLVRDVGNLAAYLRSRAPGAASIPTGGEIWDAWASGAVRCIRDWRERKAERPDEHS